MVERPQNHRKTIESNGVGAENQLMVMVEQPKNHEKTLMLMGHAKKDITIPSLLKNDHCSPLFWD